MSHTPSIPPLASPDGQQKPAVIWPPDEMCGRITSELNWEATCRSVLFSYARPLGLVSTTPAFVAMPMAIFLLYPTVNLSANLLLSFLICLASLVVGLLPRICLQIFSKRRLEVRISNMGLFQRYAHHNLSVAWGNIIWIVEFRGNVWLCSFADSCFIPREAFYSRDEPLLFVAIARELKQSCGASWHDKWNGRIFGLQPE